MAPSFPLGEHPDGDPFAAQDRERQANSRLGRMEARAQQEEQQRLKQEQAALQDRRSHTNTAAPTRAGSSTSSSYQGPSTNANGTGTGSHRTAFTVAPPPPGRAHQRNSARLSSHSSNTTITTTKKREPDLVISDTEDSSTTLNAQSPSASTAAAPRAVHHTTNILPARKRPRGEHDQSFSVTVQSGIPCVRTTVPTPVRAAPANDEADEPMSDAPARAGDDSTLLSTPAEPARRVRESSLSSIASSPHAGHTSPLRTGEEGDEEEDEEDEGEEQEEGEGDPEGDDDGEDDNEQDDEDEDDDHDEDDDDDEDDEDDEDDDDDDEDSEADSEDEDSKVAASVTRPKTVDGVPDSDENMGSPGKDSKPATNAVGSTSNGTDEKKDAKPSPPPPGMSAVRLTYSFPPRGTDHGVLQINIGEMAREAGYDPSKDNIAQVASSDGEEDHSDGSDRDGKQKREGEEAKPGETLPVRLPIPGVVGPPKLKKRRRAPNTVLGRFGGYDVEDPFVDDSEINLYEPKFTAQPKRAGFHVCVGPVAILTKSHRGRIPGSKNKPRVLGGPEAGADGHAAIPAASTSALPTFGAIGQGAGGPPVKPPKKKASQGTFSAEMQKEIDRLKDEVAKESFEVKNKFPPRLRPILVDVAMRALELDEYDDDFFAIMPKIFPYNLFTMKKLIKREVFPKRIAAYEAEQDRQIEIIRQNVVELLPISKKNHAEDYAHYRAERAAWEEKERKRLEGSGGTPEPIQGGFPSIAGVAAATGSDDEDATGPGLATTGPREPIYKFRFNEAMRVALYNACEIGDRMSELIVEKQELEKAVEQGQKVHSAANDRKILYAKLLKFWPSGDMTSNQLSREMSAAKNKLIRQSQR